MRAFTKGILVGIGVGFLIAPMTGEEMRRVVNQRFTALRESLPDDANAYVQQITERVSQTGENLRGYAQQAVSRVKDSGSTLGDLAQQSAQEVKSAGSTIGDLAQKSAQEVKKTGQDLADTTKSTTNTVKPNPSTTRVISDNKTSPNL